MLSFEKEILQWMNPHVLRVVPQGERLSLTELLARAKGKYPDRDIMSTTIDAEADHSVALTFVAPPAKSTEDAPKSAKGLQRRRGEVRYFNPYDGALLSIDELTGQSTFQTVERIHRGMVAGPIGRTVVGSCALLLFVMALSGLYLRWPRRAKWQWRTWFKINSQVTGRPYLWSLHTVIATCVLPLVLMASLTGAYQAFDWYRKSVMNLVGATPPTREATKLDQPLQVDGPNAESNLDLLWSNFQRMNGDFKSATIIFPPSLAHATEVRYLKDNSPHERAFNLVAMHPLTGEVVMRDEFAEKKAGNRFISGILPLHTGTYFGLMGRILMLLSALSMPFFAVTGWMMYVLRRRRLQISAAPTLAEAQQVG